jgi:hypothetical protein
MSVFDVLTELRREPSRAPVLRNDEQLVEARNSLRYWEQRHRQLPWYRRSDRREAGEMAGRWRDHIRAFEHRRLGRGPAGQLVALFGAHLARTLVHRAAVALAVAAVVLLVVIVALVAFWPEIAPALRDIAAIVAGGA